jgi:hypothetical protein
MVYIGLKHGSNSRVPASQATPSITKKRKKEEAWKRPVSTLDYTEQVSQKKLHRKEKLMGEKSKKASRGTFLFLS